MSIAEQDFGQTVAQGWSEEQMVPVARQLRASLAGISHQVYHHNAHLLHRYGRWFLLAWLAALVDGKVLLAIALSTLAYHLVEQRQGPSRAMVEHLSARLRSHLVQIGQHPLGMGVLTFALTYGLAAAGAEMGSGWATMGLVGVGLLSLLALLGAPPSTVSPEAVSDADLSPPDALEGHWHNLTAPDPLQRLLAVRALLRWSLSSDTVGGTTYLPGTPVTVRSHLVDCFRVMLTHESEPLVRVALIEGLKALQPKPQLSAGQPEIPPLASRPRAVEVHRSVEYVEP